jgi:hypothetical protein
VIRSRIRTHVALGLGLLMFAMAAGAARAQAAAAQSTPTRVEAEKLIAQLEATDFEARRAAQLRLNSLGGDALPAVEAALADGVVGPEAQNRLRVALPYLKARARREGPERERLAWKLAQIKAAYDVGPDTSPRWDAQAKEAIDLFTRLSADPAAQPAMRAKALAAFAKASDLGCEDPLFLAAYHLTVNEKFGRDEGPVGEAFEHVIKKVQRAKYPPIIRLWAAQRFIRATRLNDHDILSDAMRDFAAAAKTPGLPPTELETSASQLFDAIARIPNGFEVFGKDMLVKAYEKVAPGSHGALVIKGRFHLDLAWRVYRNQGWGRNVAAPVWQSFSDNLAQAAEAFEAAWKLDPTDARVAALLISCQFGDKGAQREGVETWFARAVAADPDCLAAYDRKLYALSPWWYGDGYKDGVSFARECLATGNWRAGIPMLLIAEHRAASEHSGDAKAYYARPDVWADLSAVYEGQLANFPDDALRRSELANAAAQSGRWDVVQKQLDLLGDRAVVSVFGGQTTLDYMKRKAARLGGATTSPTRAPAAAK